jgi:hypothetical protein
MTTPARRELAHWSMAALNQSQSLRLNLAGPVRYDLHRNRQRDFREAQSPSDEFAASDSAGAVH